MEEILKLDCFIEINAFYRNDQKKAIQAEMDS